MKRRKVCVSCKIFFIIIFIQFHLNNSDIKEKKCYRDLLHNTSNCKLICPPGSFALVGMNACHPLLNCNAEITILSLISSSVVKTVYLVDWRGYNVVLSVLTSLKYKDDFMHNLFMIKSLSPHKFIVQLLGFCELSLLTEYYELGSALNIQHHLNNSLKVHDNVKTRFKLCINYVSILRFLHNSPVGVRVMCDSSTLEKTLSQYLVTVELYLVVNDLDAAPEVNPLKGGIHCGKKELIGNFIAPEQAWPYPEKEFDINELSFYDEKTDIFKVPEVCNWFLGSNSDTDVIKYKLFNIHKGCKNSDPSQRPNAKDIVNNYENILHEIP